MEADEVTSPYPTLQWHHRPQTIHWAGGWLERVLTSPRGSMSPSLAHAKLLVSHGLSKIRGRNNAGGCWCPPPHSLHAARQASARSGRVQGVPRRGLSLLSLNRLPLTRPITADFPKEASELEQEGGGAEEGTPGPSTAHCWALGPTGSASPEG